MECPRCGARLSRISLGGARSVYCEACRFADVESDHTRHSDGEETWDDALERFRTARADETNGDDPSDGDTRVYGDDAPLETVDGIDPAYAARLAAVGVTTLGDLAAVDAAETADRLDTSESTVAGWATQARRLVADAGAATQTDDAADDA